MNKLISSYCTYCGSKQEYYPSKRYDANTGERLMGIRCSNFFCRHGEPLFALACFTGVGIICAVLYLF